MKQTQIYKEKRANFKISYRKITFATAKYTMLKQTLKTQIQNHLTQEAVLQSPIFLCLKEQFNDLIEYTNSLVIKLNKNYDYLNELEKNRLEQIEDLKKKYEKPSEPVSINIDHKLLINFKDSVLKEMNAVSGFYQSFCKDGKQREDKLNHVKDLMKSLKKENDDLNRKLHDLQDIMAKNIDHLEYCHSKFNELEGKVVEMFRGQSIA